MSWSSGKAPRWLNFFGRGICQHFNSKVEGGEEEALMEDCHCILVVFSVTDLHSLREAETLLQGLWQSGHLNTKAVIVVGNKIDLARAREVPIDGENWGGEEI